MWPTGEILGITTLQGELEVGRQQAYIRRREREYKLGFIPLQSPHNVGRRIIRPYVRTQSHFVRSTTEERREINISIRKHPYLQQNG